MEGTDVECEIQSAWARLAVQGSNERTGEEDERSGGGGVLSPTYPGEFWPGWGWIRNREKSRTVQGWLEEDEGCWSSRPTCGQTQTAVSGKKKKKKEQS
jgi:hypothetical protein